MFRIRKLYTEPVSIDPVHFKDGVNFILGVEDSSSNKTNGVGKTLCIEFINFALLKQKTTSRLNLIPSSALTEKTHICLDIEVNSERLTIKRSLTDSERPTILTDDSVTKFEKLDDAKAYIEAKLFPSMPEWGPSFRSLLGPLIRDEQSEFKSLIGCYDTMRRVPDDYTPHIYLLGLNLLLYKKVKLAVDKIAEYDKDIKKVKENVRLVRMKDIKFARADLNELDKEVRSVEESIEALENLTGYELVKDEIIELENIIEKKRRENYILCQKYSGTKLIDSESPVDIDEVTEYYQRISERLGDCVSRDLGQVIEFQNKVHEFQNKLIQEKREELKSKIDNLNRELSELDRQYRSRLRLLDKDGDLKNIKQTYAIFQAKSEEFNELKVFIAKHDDLVVDNERAKLDKDKSLIELQSAILDEKVTIESFEKTILHIHEFVQGNSRASFKVKQTRFKRIIDIELRIDDDGSHSIEREKVFIYDLALLLNEYTVKHHLGMLIHDNIFDVDQDTLTKNIMYLLTEAKFTENQQYILTLNADRLTRELKSAIKPFVRAEYTKERRFLKTKYKEERKKR